MFPYIIRKKFWIQMLHNEKKQPISFSAFDRNWSITAMPQFLLQR